MGMKLGIVSINYQSSIFMTLKRNNYLIMKNILLLGAFLMFAFNVSAQSDATPPPLQIKQKRKKLVALRKPKVRKQLPRERIKRLVLVIRTVLSHVVLRMLMVLRRHVVLKRKQLVLVTRTVLSLVALRMLTVLKRHVLLKKKQPVLQRAMVIRQLAVQSLLMTNLLNLRVRRKERRRQFLLPL